LSVLFIMKYKERQDCSSSQQKCTRFPRSASGLKRVVVEPRGMISWFPATQLAYTGSKQPRVQRRVPAKWPRLPGANSRALRSQNSLITLRNAFDRRVWQRRLLGIGFSLDRFLNPLIGQRQVFKLLLCGISAFLDTTHDCRLGRAKVKRRQPRHELKNGTLFRL
jgi:hypothetical protein